MAAIIAGAVLFVLYRSRPSGHIGRYSAFYHNDTSPPGNGAVRITYLGTTTLLLDDGVTQLMTDGFFTRPGLLRSIARKVETDTALAASVLKKVRADRVRALFVAHSHVDHALDAAFVARRTGAVLYGSPSTLNVGRGGALREDRMALYEPGKELRFGQFRVTVLASSHSPQHWLVRDAGEQILHPHQQPTGARTYREGGSYDLLVRHGRHTILIKPSASHLHDALDSIGPDVLFLGVGALGRQTPEFQNAYLDSTIGIVHPKLVVPIHWDDFFKPLSEELPAANRLMDDLPVVFDSLEVRRQRNGFEFKVLQGYASVLLPAPTAPPR